MRKLIFIIIVISMLVSASLAIAGEELVYRSENKVWIILKIDDEMSDRIDHVLIGLSLEPEPDNGHIAIYYHDDLMFIVALSECVANDLSPDYGNKIRIDKNKPFNIHGSFQYIVNEIETDLISQMKNGNYIKIKRDCFGDDNEIITVMLEGFEDAYNQHLKLTGWK